METSKRLQGIGEYYFSQKLREIEQLNKAGKDIINLGIGSPDQAPHADVIKTLQEETAKTNVHGYQSYKGSPVLRKAISEWYAKWYSVELDPEKEILPLIGSKEGLMHVAMTYLGDDDAALIPNPGYPTYQSAVKLAGALPVSYELSGENNWQVNPGQLQEILNKAEKKIKLLFVNYPHMPTGTNADYSTFESLVAFAKANQLLVIHDNPYSFILNEKPVSLLSVPGAKDCVIELNSLSKSHNLAGWRVGMLCGAAERIEEVLRFKSNMDSGMFLPVQLAAAKALSLGQDWFDRINATYQTRKQKALELLDLLDCTYADKQSGLFVWAGVPGDLPDGYALSDKVLYGADVFITPGGIFGTAGKKYIRVSLCASVEKIEEAIQRIKNSNTL